MVKHHLDNGKGNVMGNPFQLSAKDLFMHHLTDRIVHTTSCGALAEAREIAQRIHMYRSIG